MRIKCPYCGERDAEEFGYLGAGDPARPDPGAQPTRPRRSTTTSICATTRRGRCRSSGITAAAAARWLIVERDTRSHAILSAAFARPCAGRGRLMPSSQKPTGFRLPRGGLIDRSRTLSFTFDGETYRGYRRRHARFGAARQRRASRRPLVQVSPPARHPHRGLRGAQRAGRVAQRRAARAQHARDRD